MKWRCGAADDWVAVVDDAYLRALCLDIRARDKPTTIEERIE
jgi:hypothetical protein